MDNNFSFDFSNGFYEDVDFNSLRSEKKQYSDGILGAVAIIAEAAMYGDAGHKAVSKEIKYVADLSKEQIDLIEKGYLTLDINKAGEIFAQFKDGNLYSKKIPIKKEILAAGVDPLLAAQAIQMQAIEKKLDALMDTMEAIGQDVSMVLQGQQNDRIALYNSGCVLFLESRSVSDPMMKKILTAQALKALNDGNEQLLREMQTSIQYLLDGKYKAKKNKSAADIKEKMAVINKSFDIIHRCYFLKAMVYYDSNEPGAMLTALDEYGRFIQNVIVPNAGKLTEFDPTDLLLTEGKWEKRAQQFEQIGEIKAQMLNAPMVYAIPGSVSNEG